MYVCIGFFRVPRHAPSQRPIGVLARGRNVGNERGEACPEITKSQSYLLELAPPSIKRRTVRGGKVKKRRTRKRAGAAVRRLFEFFWLCW